MPAQAGIHEHSELRSMDKGVLLGTLVVRVDPSLRWDDDARVVMTQPTEAARVSRRVESPEQLFIAVADEYSSNRRQANLSRTV